MRSLARARRPLAALLLALALPAAGCGGYAPPAGPSDPFVAQFPDEGPGTPSAWQPPPLPPPSFPRPPAWDEAEATFERVARFGSFPSDIGRLDATIFATDADAVEESGAFVVAFDASGPSVVPSAVYAPVRVDASLLVDSQGQPGSLEAPVGFGPFLNDLCIVSPRMGFVLASAGGSDSVPTLSNLIVFDPTEGVVRQVVNLANPVAGLGPLFDSAGAPVPGDAFVQSGAEGVEWVPSPSGGGRLFVAMSNLVFGGPSFGTVKYPGTVQVFAVDPEEPTPVRPLPAPGFATATLLVRDANPVAVTRLSVTAGPERVLVTVAGTTAYDGQGNLVPATRASVEAYDAETLALLGRFELGLAGLSGTRPALGTDAVGHEVAFFASSVRGEVYLLRLDGLFAPVVDPARVAVLRGPLNGIPIDPTLAGGPGGNVAGIALSSDGRTLVVSGFGDLFAYPGPRPGRLYALSLPLDLAADSAFARAFLPGTTSLATAAGRTLGPCLIAALHPEGPEVFVLVGGTISASTWLGEGPGSLGTLRTWGRIR